MQTCVKDGKVTIVMTYEEWQDLYPAINNDRLVQPMLSEINQTQRAFNEIVCKELNKIPDYLRRTIESNTVGFLNIIPIPIKKEVIR